MTGRSLKPSDMLPADATLQAEPAHPWVSRGGVKLAGALEQYPIDVEGHVCLDVGASTGGFTEVLLANGAAIVFAIDVGHGQLHRSLQGHAKIVSMEATDIRKLEGTRLPARPDIVTIDVSFISLKAVLPAALSLAAAPMHLLALIKPQFEAQGKHGKGGIIRDAAVHQQVCDDIAAFAAVAGLHGHQGVSLRDRGRRRQHRILPRRAPWLKRLIIDHVGHRGDGVALGRRRGGLCALHACRRDGRGRSRRRPSRPRRLLAVTTASPERIAPFCPHFGVCGGCAIQHWQADRYRAWKRNIVVETLRQAKLDCEVAPLVDAHGAGRRRITCMRGSARMTC